MRISYERTGGLIGRKVKYSVDLADLPTDQAEILKQLLEKADFLNLPEHSISNPMPDEFIYTITVDTATIQHTVLLRDTNMSDSIRPLVEDLSARARLRAGKRNP